MRETAFTRLKRLITTWIVAALCARKLTKFGTARYRHALSDIADGYYCRPTVSLAAATIRYRLESKIEGLPRHKSALVCASGIEKPHGKSRAALLAFRHQSDDDDCSTLFLAEFREGLLPYSTQENPSDSLR